ncbi:FUSC family protein [Lacibacter luteus]|uniref:FUSC family protein n=1 Tax=Lacibacter luteus TaxID=2508719 RepID=A0A4V1M7Y4_9BACT|nr:FUSC family protein [Lacibacter luteus]RXK61962.1 FUSC family protein [Lacibacter luteus]
MNEQESTQVKDKELSAEAKKARSTAITNAVFIGFLIGIVLYSIVMNSWGFLTLIPLYLIYKLINNGNSKK